MLKSEETPVSAWFFENDHAVCMFDPDTFKVYLYDAGRWVESDDLKLRETSVSVLSNSAKTRRCSGPAIKWRPILWPPCAAPSQVSAGTRSEA